ncbi:MAG TPA: ribose 5-phosphate isomerase B [Candidatus Limnocylindria bacterium]|nr:ribose 5-phosphate isomerase B [Candidatus Limnocylindria bacterium]
MIALGSDHAGRPLKLEIIKLLQERGEQFIDYGTDSEARCDYPVYGRLAAEAVADGRCERGIIFCGTGIGISISANKVPGIRCAVCSDCYSAVMSRAHNDANMLALGARVVGIDLARMIVGMWLDTEFEGGRHAARVDLIRQIESDFEKGGKNSL